MLKMVLQLHFFTLMTVEAIPKLVAKFMFDVKHVS